MKKSLATIAVATALLVPALGACSSDSKSEGKGTSSASPSPGGQNSQGDATETGEGEKGGAVDSSAFSLTASDKYKLDDGGSLASITGDASFATQGIFSFLGQNTLVLNEGNNGYKSNVYRGVKLSDGSQVWRLDVSLPQGVKDLKNAHVGVEQVGNTLLAYWSGNVGGDALNEAKEVSYLQQFNLDTGKKMDEVKVDGPAEYKIKGLGRYLIPEQHGDNASVKVFYPSGTAMETERDALDNMAAQENLTKPLRGANGYGVNYIGSPWVVHTTPGKGYVVYDGGKNGKLTLRAVDTKAAKFIGPEVFVKEGSSLEGTSLSGAATARSGVVVNSLDPTKMVPMADALKAQLNNISLDDDGNILAIAAATGDPTWVYGNATTKQAKILDKVEDNNMKVHLSNGYIVKETTVTASDSQGKALWTGNVMVSKVKGAAAK